MVEQIDFSKKESAACLCLAKSLFFISDMPSLLMAVNWKLRWKEINIKKKKKSEVIKLFISSHIFYIVSVSRRKIPSLLLVLSVLCCEFHGWLQSHFFMVWHMRDYNRSLKKISLKAITNELWLSVFICFSKWYKNILQRTSATFRSVIITHRNCGGAHGVMVIVVGNGHVWHKFKSWTRLIAFHIALIPLGKVWIQLFSLQLWVNSRTGWFLQPWWGN